MVVQSTTTPLPGPSLYAWPSSPSSTPFEKDSTPARHSEQSIFLASHSLAAGVATMDAAVSLHHHGLPASLPPSSHHHRALPLPLNQRRPSTKPPAARLTLATRPTSPARSAPAAALPAAAVAAAATAHYSSRAATGYAAALADACARAGTLRRAARHARAALGLSQRQEAVGQLDARVAALVRMLVAKGNPGMVAEVLAEFAAICDKLLPLPPARAHGHGY